MRQIKRGHAIEVKQVSDAGDIEGYGSTFGNVDQGYDIVEPGAFEKTLEERGLPKMLWGHDFWEPPIGKWTKAKEDDFGLFLKGQINLDTQRGAEVHSNLKMGTLDGLSIGYLEKDADFANGVRHLKEIDLFEVSVVTFPMNELARVDAVKQKIEDGISKRELEHILQEAGMSRAQARKLIKHGHEGLYTRDAVDTSDDDELRAIVDKYFS